MLLKLYLMFYSKWFLEKIGNQGTGEHGQVLFHLLALFPPLCSFTSLPSSSSHYACSPPHPLLPPTVLVHFLVLFFAPLCSFTSSPSSSPNCTRPPPHPLLLPTVLVHLLTLFFPQLYSSTFSSSSSPTVLVHLLTLFFPSLCSFISSPSSSPPLFQVSTICWLLMRTRVDMLSIYPSTWYIGGPQKMPIMPDLLVTHSVRLYTQLYPRYVTDFPSHSPSINLPLSHSLSSLLPTLLLPTISSTAFSRC